MNVKKRGQAIWVVWNTENKPINDLITEWNENHIPNQDSYGPIGKRVLSPIEVTALRVPTP